MVEAFDGRSGTEYGLGLWISCTAPPPRIEAAGFVTSVYDDAGARGKWSVSGSVTVIGS